MYIAEYFKLRRSFISLSHNLLSPPFTVQFSPKTNEQEIYPLWTSTNFHLSNSCYYSILFIKSNKDLLPLINLLPYQVPRSFLIPSSPSRVTSTSPLHPVTSSLSSFTYQSPNLALKYTYYFTSLNIVLNLTSRHLVHGFRYWVFSC